MYSCGPLHMNKQRQDDQLEPTYNSSVPIRDVSLKTCREQWTIGRGGERGAGISVLMAQQDDDDDDKGTSLLSYGCIYINVGMHHMDANKTCREKVKYELHKNATCSLLSLSLSHSLSVVYKKEHNYFQCIKNITYFFLFPFMMKCTKNWCEREGQRWLSYHTHRGNSWVFLWKFSAFLLCSAFMRLVQNQLKTFNHLSFFFVLLSFEIIPAFDFSESVSSHFSTFSSLFLHISLLHVPTIISRHLIILASSF